MKEKIIALRLRELRKSLSLKEMQKLVGIPSTTIDRAERGESDPKSELISTYCSVFGVSSDWLLGLVEDQNPEKNQHQSLIGARHVVSQLRANAEKAMRKAEELIQIMDEIEKSL